MEDVELEDKNLPPDSPKPDVDPTSDALANELKQTKNKWVVPAYIAIVIFALLLIFLVAVATVIVTIWGVLGVVGFESMFKANPYAGPSWGCYHYDRTLINPSTLENVPEICGASNTSMWKYLNVPLNSWKYVNFTARESGDVDSVMKLKGILLMANLAKDPFVIMQHGIRSCKESAYALMPAAMLWRNGFNVLLIDLRNHGSSEISQYAFASFGLQEHYDVLGGLDYLVANYPRLANITDTVGMWGASMGGATVAIAAARTTMVNAMWLEAAALMVRETLEWNVKSQGFDVPFVMNSVCGKAEFTWPFGCPPFKLNPITLYTNKDTPPVKHVFMSHKTDDTLVPFFNSENSVPIMKNSGVNVTLYSTRDPNAPSYCRHHCDIYSYEPIPYEKRLVAFFNDHLKRLP